MSPRNPDTTISLEPISERRDSPGPTSLNNEEQSNEVQLSRDTYFKLASTGLSFLFSGMNDGSLGALIPYLIRSYGIDTDLVSVVYGTTFAGWFLTALINTYLCRYFDLGAMLTIGALLQLIAQVLRSWLPPFPLFAVTFFVQSFGMALQDTHSNNFVTTIKAAHRWLGFIHAMYALGTLIGPTVATAIASSESPSRWYLFYTTLVAIGAVNLFLVIFAFKDSLNFTFRSVNSSTDTHDNSQKPSPFQEMKAVMRLPSVWLLSLYFFAFLGAVLTASGWVVEYLVTVRNGDLSQVGYVQTGFAGGTFLGRLLLAEPTKRLGERRMVFVYALLCLALELVFWLVPNIIAGAVAISLFGFFAGPFFATGVSVGAQIFPPHLRSSSLAFMFMMGQVGGAIFPAITGLIASRTSVKVLQPILVGLCSATAATWLLVPRSNLHRD